VPALADEHVFSRCDPLHAAIGSLRRSNRPANSVVSGILDRETGRKLLFGFSHFEGAGFKSVLAKPER
jgi:hypothetical protein